MLSDPQMGGTYAVQENPHRFRSECAVYRTTLVVGSRGRIRIGERTKIRTGMGMKSRCQIRTHGENGTKIGDCWISRDHSDTRPFSES